MDGAIGGMPQSFEVAVLRTQARSVTVLASGELDIASLPKLRACFADLATEGAVHVVLDLGNLSFIDSVGLGLLVRECTRVTAAGGTFAVRNVRPRTMQIFEMTGLIEPLSVTGAGGDADAGPPELPLEGGRPSNVVARAGG